MTAEDPHEAALRRAGAVRSYIQGEVLELPDVCVVLADAAWPLSVYSATVAADAGYEGLIAVPEPVDLVAVVTQTCDLQETTADACLCQVAPVVDRGDTFAHAAQRGRHPGWVALPWHSDGSVADLSRISTVERSVLVGAVSLGRPGSPVERLHFAEAVSRHFTRVALPDPVCFVLAPFLQRMKEKYDRQSDEGKCIARIANLRIEATPDLDDASPDLRLLIILETSDLPPVPDGADLDDARINQLVVRGHAAAAKQALEAREPLGRREAWVALAELWIKDSATRATTSPGVGSVDVEVLSGDEMSFTRLRNAPELDLAYLSTRAA